MAADLDAFSILNIKYSLSGIYQSCIIIHENSVTFNSCLTLAIIKHCHLLYIQLYDCVIQYFTYHVSFDAINLIYPPLFPTMYHFLYSSTPLYKHHVCTLTLNTHNDHSHFCICVGVLMWTKFPSSAQPIKSKSWEHSNKKYKKWKYLKIRHFFYVWFYSWI